MYFLVILQKPRNREMQFACHAQRNRDVGYRQSTWGDIAQVDAELARGIPAVHPDCGDNAALLYLTHRGERLCCTCAGRRGDSAGAGKMRHDERPRLYLAAFQPVSLRRKFCAELPRDVRELRYTCADDRARATAILVAMRAVNAAGG